MQYYATEYPFAFIIGQTRFDIPYSVYYHEHLPDDSAWGYTYPQTSDVTFIDYKYTSDTDVTYMHAYRVLLDDTHYRIIVYIIATAATPFTLTETRTIHYDDGQTYKENTDYTSTTYTYNDKTTHYVYKKYDISTSTTAASEFSEIFANPVNALSANDYNVWENTQPEQYFAWLTQYGDNPYTNDPYNRPPETEDAPRGGQGNWDNSSDVVTIDPLPAGLWGQGFVSVYVPTVAQLQAFATQIWREDLKNTWKDLFPSGVLSGIVDCFTIPIQPDTSGTGVITIGTQPVGAESAILANRFKIVDFGNLTIGEYFGAFADYTTTKIAIYLPYIGWEQLAPEMVINATINLQYKIDCMSGDFVAIISTNRYDKFRFEGVSYVFNGNCATKIPLTSQAGAGTSSTISAAISGIGGTAAGLMSGNYIGAAMSAASAVNSICADTNKHTFALKGGFSGAKGQLGAQRPYLIINRPVMENGAKNQYFNLCGIPSNDYATIGSCRGFTKCYAVKLDDSNFAGATEDEKQQIISLLQGGIFV